DQELRGKIGNFIYWEGAGQAFDEAGKPIGLAYTELTGYTESLYGKF
ncbi:MAG: lipocalin family protein, partial [Verrucomicrobiia bacterium]